MTYSIVARDPQTGEVGVAVQSHWFSVGSQVSWAEPGVGAVATQSFAEPAYGPRLLERLRGGEEPHTALRELLAADPAGALRQVAVVAADGRTAVHTGAGCIAFAGHVEGDGFTAQANMMASQAVWPAMAEAFEAATGPLAARLLAALDAAEAAGGDVRGRQSAALVVAPAQGEPWRRAVELRVEDDPEPLAELRRLLRLHEAYALAAQGDELAGQGRYAEAGERYCAALRLAPESEELGFWAGLALAHADEFEEGVARVREAVARHAGWRDLLERLPAGLAPRVAAVRAALDDRPLDDRSPG